MIMNMKATILISVLTIGCSNAQITSGGATTFNAGGTSCSDVLTQCSFSGTCCSLTDYDETGCTLTILGGTCSPSGSECPWQLSATSTSSDACPVGDYDVSLDAEPSTTNNPGAASTSAGGNLGTRGFQCIAGFCLLFNYAIWGGQDFGS